MRDWCDAQACEKFPLDTSLMLGIARVHDALNEQAQAIAMYKKVLQLDASNVEAIACLAVSLIAAHMPR